MKYNVFDTQAEADAAQEVDFQAWKAARPQEPAEYWNITTSWAIPRQRATDNKYVYPVCPEGDQTHVQEAYNSNWFPEEGE